jgi:hypothetical protein
VCALVAQLSGTFQREQADGTNVRVTMRLTESGKDPPAGHYFAYATAAAGLAIGCRGRVFFISVSSAYFLLRPLLFIFALEPVMSEDELEPEPVVCWFC